MHTSHLVVALDALRDAFADPPALTGPVDGCGRCFSDRDLDLLDGDPALVPDDLARRFAEEEPWHWNETQYGLLWRRLARRIVSTLTGPDRTAEPGLLLRGLGVDHSGFHYWPRTERTALEDALAALLAVAVTDGRKPEAIVDLLGGLALIHDDIGPWFARVDALSGPAAEAGVVRLACHWAVELLWGEQPIWWWYPDDPVGLVTRWLCSPAVRVRVERFATAHPRCKNAADTLIALDALDAGKPSPWLHPEYGWQLARRYGPADPVRPL